MPHIGVFTHCVTHFLGSAKGTKKLPLQDLYRRQKQKAVKPNHTHIINATVSPLQENWACSSGNIKGGFKVILHVWNHSILQVIEKERQSFITIGRRKYLKLGCACGR